MSSSIMCRYIVTDKSEGFLQKFEPNNLTSDNTALVCINIYGLLTEDHVPCRKRYLTRYSQDELEHRDHIALTNIVPLMQSVRSFGMPVVYVSNSIPNIAVDSSAVGEIYDTHLGLAPHLDFGETGNDPNEYVLGEGNIQYAGSLSPQSWDFYIRKWTYSGFASTWLDRLLRNIGVQYVLLLGFDTECDVLCTGLDATALGYRTVIVRDSISTARTGMYFGDLTYNDRWILHFEEAVGYTVTSQELCEYLDS